MTEREHERMMSELVAKHNEEISQLRTALSLELRESMEAAHQAELQQVQVYYLHTPTHTLTHSQCDILNHTMEQALFSCSQKYGNYNT